MQKKRLKELYDDEEDVIFLESHHTKLKKKVGNKTTTICKKEGVQSLECYTTMKIKFDIFSFFNITRCTVTTIRSRETHLHIKVELSKGDGGLPEV